MGIHQLNRFLQSTCDGAITKMHMSTLKNKTIVIDTSIYMYKYAKTESIIEGIYRMIITLLHFEIKPIFIFDGKPPVEKQKELENRKKCRENAKLLYDELYKNISEIGYNNLSDSKKKELERLKRSMIKITKNDVLLIKSLLDAYGICHKTAKGEADILCASLVIKKKVFAVLTEDMDLFAYGSTIILRYLSLSQHSCILYNLKSILKKLEINKNDFQLICVLSGNDYYESKKNIYYYLKIYKKYKKTLIEKKLLDWLIINKYIKMEEINEITNTLNIYRNIKKELTYYENFNIRFNSVCKKSLKKILELDRFIF